MAAPHRVRRHEGLRLRGNRRKHAFLREADAIGAAAVFSLVEARAADLDSWSARRTRKSSRRSSHIPCVYDSNGTRLQYAGEAQAEVVGNPSADAGRAVGTSDLVVAERDTRLGAEAATSASEDLAAAALAPA